MTKSGTHMEGIGTLDMAAGSFYGTRLFTWRNSLCIMEEDFMAMSLLYGLLGVKDLQTLEALVTQHSQHPNSLSLDEKRVVKYHCLPSKHKREVRKALYDALYAILEYADVNRDLSMAIGAALCNAISRNSQGDLLLDPHINPGLTRLGTVLKPIVSEAIDEV